MQSTPPKTHFCMCLLTKDTTNTQHAWTLKVAVVVVDVIVIIIIIIIVIIRMKPLSNYDVYMDSNS